MKVLLVLCLLLATPALADKPSFSARDVFDLSYASNPQVSPDGSFVVYTRNYMDIMTDKRRSNLWRIDIDGSNALPITTGARNNTGAAISPDSERIAFVSADDKGGQIFVRWLAGGESLQVTRFAHSPKNLAWSPDGRWLAFSMLVPSTPITMGKLPAKPKGADWADAPTVVNRSVFRSDGKGELLAGFTHVFVVPAGGGAPRQLSNGDYNHAGTISWAADSQSLYFSANRHENWELDVLNTDIYKVSVDGDELTQVTKRRGPDNSVTVSPDGNTLAWTGFDDQRMSHQINRLYVMNTDGSSRRELLSGLDRSVANPRWAADGKGLYFQYNDKGSTKLAYVSLRDKLNVISDELSGLSFSRPYTGAAFAVGGKNSYAFTIGNALSPANIAAGRGTGKARQLTHLNDNLLPHRQMAQVEELWLKSAHDGLAIQAWVVRPAGFDPTKTYPLLLEIHGGPATAYGPHFSAEIQLYAAAGYVVVYANPRGSTSYGEGFAQRIHHNYPSEDYDDLMSAVDTVIAQGSIDTDQLYVTGGSGGGVLTAWIVGKTDRFRAAVVAKPVINWASFVLSADMPPYFSQYWFPKMPWEDPMDYWRRSPLSLVGNVSTPTMLLVGGSDLRTPTWESEQYYQALKLRGIDTALVRLPGAYHSIAKRPSQLLAKVAAILEWFERHRGETSINQPEN